MVVLAAALVALSAAAGPLFLSSVATQALHNAAANRCVEDDQITVALPAVVVDPDDPFRDRRQDRAAADASVRAAMDRAGLPSPGVTSYGAVGAAVDDNPPVDAVLGLFSRIGADRDVEILRGSLTENGLLVTDTAARELALDLGSRVEISDMPLVVSGIYRDLDTASFRTVLPDAWCHWRAAIVSDVSSQPPPFVLISPATHERLGLATSLEWTSPTVIDELTFSQASAIADRGEGLFTRADLAVESLQSSVSGAAVRSTLGADLDATAQVRDDVAVLVLTTAGIGGGVALTLVVGAVLSWKSKRRSELRLLSSRGIGPVGMGLKAGSELAAPLLLGSAAGWLAAVLVVPRLAPSSLVESAAPAQAMAGAGWGFVASLVLVLIAGGLATWEPTAATSISHTTALRTIVVFGVVLTGLAAWLVKAAAGQGSIALGRISVDALLVLAPVLGLVGACTVAAGLLTGLAIPTRDRLRRRPRVVSFLAAARLVAAGLAVPAALAGVALPVGVSAYSTGYAASTEYTVAQKAEIYAGAPISLDLAVRFGEVPAVGSLATPVSMTQAFIPDGDPAGAREIQLIAVDPRNFDRFAFDDERVLGGSLGGFLDQLTADGSPGRASALFISPSGRGAPDSIRVRSSTLDVDVVARPDAFPGMRAVGRDAVVVNLAALSGVDAYAPWRNQLWTTEANSATLLNQLSQQEVFIDDVDEPVGFLAVTNLLPLTWSFDFLTVVAVLIAVVSLTGLALFVAARARRQRLSAVMLRRMGLSRRGLQAALATELIGIVTAGWIIGSLTGIAGLSLAASTTDPYPGYPPSTLLQYPTAIIALTGAGLLIAGLALSAVTGRAAKPDEAAQILRTTEQ